MTENEKEKIEREIDEETMREIVKKVLEHPEKFQSESMLILVINTWYRQGPSYDDYNVYNVVEGEVREIVLEEWNEGYPYRAGRKMALIPLTMPVIVVEEGFADNVSPPRGSKIVHVFTSEGWKKIRVY